MEIIIMNDLIKTHLTAIQSSTKDLLESIVYLIRVTKGGNLQLFLKEQIDTSLQEEFTTAIETLDAEITTSYLANLNEFDEPIPYKDKNGNKKLSNPAIIIHKIGEDKSLDDMFADLEA
jgi:hypothetical protein